MSEYNTVLPNTDGLNVPSKPSGDGAAGGKGQATRRYSDTFYDNHRHPVRFPMGRPWCGERELAANPDLKHPDGFITTDLQQGVHVADDYGNVNRRETFLSVWHAPYIPISKYFKFNYKRKAVSFDYQRMRLEESQAYDAYYEAAALMGAQINRQVEYGVVPHFQITSKLGLPTKLVTIADALIAGDPWILGFTDEPNVELAKILGFTSAGIKRPTSYTPQPIVTPEQVIATPPDELLRMMADLAGKAAASAVTAILADRDRADAEKRSAHGAKVKAGKAKKANVATGGVAA